MKLAIGPGALVAAAFIGPGTVTACTLAGANFGFALLWALAFATIATIVLQDMTARLGAGARLGLGEALMQAAARPWLKLALAILVLAALAVGNSTYQAGNLAGGALGLSAALGDGAPDQRLLVAGLALIAGVFLFQAQYRVLERTLIALVLVMSLAFAASAILARPDLGTLAQGLIPRVPEGGLLTAIALIGTTIVPYNLFLHAAAARRRWEAADGVDAARSDTMISIGLGGLVSMMILATAAASLFGAGLDIRNAADMAAALEPSFGPAARYVVGLGLAAAGLTSAITAPAATGYVLAELDAARQSRPPSEARRTLVFRIAALSVLALGAGFAVSAIRPVSLILIAQAANALLLPVLAIFLLAVMNRRSLLGDHANGLVSNIAGAIVVLITAGLGARGLLRLFGVEI